MATKSGKSGKSGKAGKGSKGAGKARRGGSKGGAGAAYARSPRPPAAKGSSTSGGGGGRRTTSKSRGEAFAMFGSEMDSPQAEPFVNRNGLRNFAIHSQDNAQALGDFLGVSASGVGGAALDLSTVNAETAARHYLQSALESTDLPTFNSPEVSGEKGEFKILGTEAVPLTGTQTVKFRQVYRKIPVYGSLVTIELDDSNNLVSLNSGLGEPSNVDPVAKISPAQALEAVKRYAGYGSSPLDATPRLFYFYDNDTRRWRLVYVTENVQKVPASEEASPVAHPFSVSDADLQGGGALPSGLPEFMDYVVDAHSGELVAELPRTHNVQDNARDDLNINRQIEVSAGNGGGRDLFDPINNIKTHDFNFRNIKSPVNFNLLPGGVVQNPPAPWSPAAVSAHFNATEVAKFLKNVLLRNGLDNLGMPIISSINCVASIGTREWRNAAWLGAKKQMVYGQRDVGGGALRSYAVSLDVVAHEVLHGLTDNTAKLVYRGMSGALNESYSDIFGIIVSNIHENDIGRWNWQLGEDLNLNGVPIRDLSDPTLHNQPAHMNDYRDLPLDDDNDLGGVHINSGIHNKAAYNLLTTQTAGGSFLFTGKDVAALYYLTLSQQLAATSGFSDSRRGAEVVARTLFRNDADKDEKIAAVGSAFDAVGIV